MIKGIRNTIQDQGLYPDLHINQCEKLVRNVTNTCNHPCSLPYCDPEMTSSMKFLLWDSAGLETWK